VCGGVDTVKIGDVSWYPRVYRGIPYAAAPVGARSRRWMPPVDTTLTGTFDATRFGRICPQGKVPVDTTRMSENCLFLNVWSPAVASPSQKVPVMVFIHGGAFVMGSGSSGLYRGAALAAADTVVVVTLNYRLGALGFLAGPTSKGTAIGGNLGLMDQQKALQWVQTNISAFGGDPTKVTIFGESAGAMSVGFHLFAVPGSAPLFRAAIMESNPMGVPYRNPTQANADGAKFARTMCETMHRDPALCLDKLSATWFDANAQTAPLDSVMRAQAKFDGTTHAAERLLAGGLVQGLPWTPLVDGTFVTGQPVKGYAANMPPKPFVFGMNRDEGVLFADAGANDLTPDRYGLILGRVFGDSASDSIRKYRDASNATPYAADGHSKDFGMPPAASAFARVMTDFIFACGNLAAADSALPKQGTKPVYGYYFRRSPVPVQLYDGDTIPACKPSTGAVCHADELPYVFNTLSYADTLNGNTTKPTTLDYTVAGQMGLLWGYFAKNLTMPPGTQQLPGWQPYTKNGSVMAFGAALPVMYDGLPAASNCPRPWSNIYPLGPIGSRRATDAAWGQMPAAVPAAR
jgi:carboxylesterase type B